ncbi:hypothetical protein J9303_19565 [Bacillaceae bacterium Marseille-Q3522]|nr:hypothetical protein [Bacillaceae bacterium Marseille-Q3522]
MNRKSSMKKDRFSPTMASKIHAHLKEMKFVKTLLPISKSFIETAIFDHWKRQQRNDSKITFKNKAKIGRKTSTLKE